MELGCQRTVVHLRGRSDLGHQINALCPLDWVPCNARSLGFGRSVGSVGARLRIDPFVVVLTCTILVALLT